MRYGSGYPGRAVSVSDAPFLFGFYPLYMPGPNMKSTEEVRFDQSYIILVV